MSMQGLGILFLVAVCPLLGSLPLIDWITVGLTGRRLRQLGTGNISVSAAFYHGGQWVGSLAVLSELAKGIGAVLGTRYFFPHEPALEITALILLVIGRFIGGRGAGTTNVVWGYVVHDATTALLVLMIGGISFTLIRERQFGKMSILVVMVLITLLRYPNEGDRLAAVLVLCMVMAAIYRSIPDDLDLPTTAAQKDSQQMFRFFRGDRAILSLDQQLESARVGAKAATLAQLRRWGYPVPVGWVLPPGDDPTPLIESLYPDGEHPLVVRSSAIGEDSAIASAAGQYLSLLDITSPAALAQAILQCQASYHAPGAMQYRQTRGGTDQGMAVLVQVQVKGVFSGVAFSRDPIARQGDAVVIEALPGHTSQIVSGRVTPEQYRVWIPASAEVPDADWRLPDDRTLTMEGEGDVPPWLIQQVAYLSRHLEARYHGIPQDIEWTYDGQQLWLLQSRPITTLIPIWTRKIAAEVIPGFIPPLTWSINRPLTCGVWGEIFTLVLGDRAADLDFTETATLHHSAAYFNATLLGDIFRRMGLPPDSLEFLTRGAKFSKPPLGSTLKNLPGLGRLLGREWQLERDFQADERTHFDPTLQSLQEPLSDLTAAQLIQRIDQILDMLKRATYYSILAPLSFALRQAILKIPDADLDNRQTPEVASLRSLHTIAAHLRDRLSPEQVQHLTTDPEGGLADPQVASLIAAQLQDFLAQYGYLGEVGTDIAVPRWRDDPTPVRSLLLHALAAPPRPAPSPAPRPRSWHHRTLQRRLHLKGRVTEIYSRLLAELRWTMLEVERRWLAQGQLGTAGDIFMLTLAEVRQALGQPGAIGEGLTDRVTERRSHLERDRQQIPPPLVYGNDPPRFADGRSSRPVSAQQYQGIGASAGVVEGTVLVLRSLQSVPPIDDQTILVVPYTDSGWSPLLARAGGLIAEVGGRLSHGAIIAREYGIPAVMDIHDATRQFRNGQRVRVNGETGVVERLPE